MNGLPTHPALRLLRIGLSSQTTKKWAGASQCRPPGQIKNRPREAAATPAATPRIKGQAHRSTLPAVRPTEGGDLGTRERKTVHGHLTPAGSPTRTHGAPQLGLPSPAPTALEETPAQPLTAWTHATHSPEARRLRGRLGRHPQCRLPFSSCLPMVLSALCSFYSCAAVRVCNHHPARALVATLACSTAQCKRRASGTAALQSPFWQRSTKNS